MVDYFQVPQEFSCCFKTFSPGQKITAEDMNYNFNIITNYFNLFQTALINSNGYRQLPYVDTNNYTYTNIQAIQQEFNQIKNFFQNNLNQYALLWVDDTLKNNILNNCQNFVPNNLLLNSSSLITTFDFASKIYIIFFSELVLHYIINKIHHNIIDLTGLYIHFEGDISSLSNPSTHIPSCLLNLNLNQTLIQQTEIINELFTSIDQSLFGFSIELGVNIHNDDYLIYGRSIINEYLNNSTIIYSTGSFTQASSAGSFSWQIPEGKQFSDIKIINCLTGTELKNGNIFPCIVKGTERITTNATQTFQKNLYYFNETNSSYNKSFIPVSQNLLADRYAYGNVFSQLPNIFDFSNQIELQSISNIIRYAGIYSGMYDYQLITFDFTQRSNSQHFVTLKIDNINQFITVSMDLTFYIIIDGNYETNANISSDENIGPRVISVPLAIRLKKPEEYEE